MAGGELGGPSWACSAQLPRRLAKVICLARMPCFRAGGALGGPGRPGWSYGSFLGDLGPGE
eukprot:1146252-Pelagomonas_calceolata.AAC.2